ncbi:MAG: alkaline phosphatase family protein, partial [Acidobacteriota bacterium]
MVVISIDGLSPRYYTKEGTEKLFPTLEHFTQRGSYASGVIGVLPTLTFPSHTTLVTGATPALHGISSNLLFDPLKRNQGGWNWFAEDIKADTLWKAAARKGLKTGSVFWPVTVGARIDYLIPAFWRIGDSLDSVRLLRAVSTPRLLEEVEARFATFESQKMSDRDRARIGLYILQKYRPALMLIKLSDLDRAHHVAGPNSQQAIQALQTIDRGIADVLEGIHSEGLKETTVVAIVSDHGVSPINYVFKPEVFFRQQGWLTYQGDRVTDWRAAPVIGGGLCAVVLRDPEDHLTLVAIKELFTTLMQDVAYGIRRIY